MTWTMEQAQRADWKNRSKERTREIASNERGGSDDASPGKTPSATGAHRQPAKRHKYGAVPTERDGIRFDSRLEADRYRQLTLLKASGEVSHFLRQTPIHLPGGTKLVIDFLVFWRDGRVTYEDTKGRLTPLFKVKRREVEFLYPFEITILKRADVPEYGF